MSSPRLICKSGYIDSPLHLINTLEYAGNKIASQQILYMDGSIRNVPANKIVTLSPAELAEVYSIRLNYKDGGGKTISYEKYLEHTSETREMIRVSELNTIEDDTPLLQRADGKQYREIEELDFFKYLDYIAKREGVEKEDGHGLFGFSGDGLSGNIPIEQARAMAEQHQDSRAWSHIISLDTTAAAAAGYDNRAAWKDLIVSKAPVIADAYNISLENLVLNCAYHGNTDNPHAHLIFYSKDMREGFIKGNKPSMLKATEKLKSTFHNEIFKEDVRAVEVHKSELRKELQVSLDRHLENCLVKGGIDGALGEQLLNLAERFKDIPGRKQYGYLPADLKIAVDDILRGIIQRDNDLKTMFDSYCGLQQELISGYVSKPDTIAQKMATFQKSFFHPGRGDLRIYHNAIVACADELAEAPALFARAVREETLDSTPPDASLSTANFQAEDELTPDADAEARDFARAVREQIRDSTPPDASLSTADFQAEDELTPDADAETHDFARAVREEIRDFTPSDTSLSTADFQAEDELTPDADAEARDFARAVREETRNSTPPDASLSTEIDKKAAELIRGKKKQFDRLYRATFAGIFNPKLPRTGLQEQALVALKQIYEFSQSKKEPNPADLMQIHSTMNEIFRMVYFTDEVLRTKLDALFDTICLELQDDFSPLAANLEVEHIKQGLLSGDREDATVGYIKYFGETLKDQKYFQLLEAYQEFNKPLYKEIHRISKENFNGDGHDELLAALKQIRVLLDAKSDAEDSDSIDKAVRNEIRPLWRSLFQDDVFQETYSEYLARYNKVLSENFDESDAPKYSKRLKNTTDHVTRLMRPHYTFVQMAKNLDDFVYQETMRRKDLNKPVYKALFQSLNNALSDSETFLSLLLRQKLHRLKDGGELEHGCAAEILRLLNETDPKFNCVLGKLRTEIYASLEKDLGKDAALAQMERFYEDLFSPEGTLPIHFVLRSYAQELSEHYFRQLSFAHKDIFQQLRNMVASSVREQLIRPEVRADLNRLAVLLSQDEPDNDAIEAATAKVFRSTYSPEIDAEIERCISVFSRRTASVCDDSNMRLELTERLRTAAFGGEAQCPHNFIINCIAKNLESEKAKFIFAQMKPELKLFRSVLYQALRQAVIENAPVLFRPKEFTPEAIDVLLSGLSSPACDLVDEKQRLLQRFSDLWNQHNFTDSGADIQQLFHRFFYGSEEKYDTLYLKELIAETRDQADNIRAQYNGWLRQSCLTGICRNLLHALATMLYDQSTNANQAAQASRRTAFSSRKQFKNRRTLSQQPQFEQDDTLSY